MENLVLTRIDDRLIHGQVMTKWLKETGAEDILIIDDATAANDFMISVFEQAVPEDKGIGVFNKEAGVKFLSQPLEEPTLILVKGPETVEYLVDHGIKIDSLDLGGMAGKDGRSPLFQFISTSPEEDKCFKRLIDKGVDVYVQITPQNEKQPILPLINKKNEG